MNSYADFQLRSRYEPVWTVFDPDLRQRLANLEASATVARRVRAALHEAIPSGLTTLEAVARKLAVSKRSLTAD
jgi:hypothetical protein